MDSLFPPFSEDFDINPSLHPKMKRNIYKIIAYICFQVSRARKINVWVECNTNISMFISSQNLSFHYFCFKGTYLHYRIISLRREIYTTGVTGGAETAYPSGAPEFTRSFQWGSCYSIFSFVCMFFVDRCLSFCTFSFDHCVVCSSSIYGF